MATIKNTSLRGFISTLSQTQISCLQIILACPGMTAALRKAVGARPATLAPSTYPSALAKAMRERGWPESEIVRAVEVEGGIL